MIRLYRKGCDNREQGFSNLRKKTVLPGAGHRALRKRPEEANEVLFEFLRG